MKVIGQFQYGEGQIHKVHEDNYRELHCSCGREDCWAIRKAEGIICQQRVDAERLRLRGIKFRDMEQLIKEQWAYIDKRDERWNTGLFASTTMEGTESQAVKSSPQLMPA